MYLHWDGCFESYYSFFSHLRMKLEVAKIQYNLENLVFGSDEEKAVRKAISVCFKVGVRERDRGRILDLLFGEFGVAKVDDTLLLDRRLASLQKRR